MKNHGWTYTDRVEARFAGMSLARFYASAHPHSVEAEWRARADAGEISRNGRPAAATDILAGGDLLEWRRPPWEEGEVPRDFRIVYEDESIIAVDKPAGLPVVPDGGFLENTIVHLLSLRYPSENPVPAHRLNRGTSGLILFSRTPEARRNLAAQFRDMTARQNGEMRKIYYARTVPYPAGKPGDIINVTTPIGPVPHPWLGSVHAACPNGKPSCSKCEIVSADAASTLWKIDLVTGRPHQIRIHLASIGAPLIGEPLFLPGGAPRPDALPGDCGYFLRSVSLTFRHPASGTLTTLSVPIMENRWFDEVNHPK
jgi:23S rRNA pseudouridine1911/1915/1917 synthase